jgi:thimet oligopeptidase
MTGLEPLTFPADLDGWLAFAADRPAERRALVETIDATLREPADRGVLDLLELWNDAELALAEALHESYLISESHPDASVRATAEAQVELTEAVSNGRLLDRRLWAAFAHAADDGLPEDARRLLAHIRRDFRRGGVDLGDASRERVRELTERDTALSLTFSRNIREGRREIRVAPEALAGLPLDFVESHPVGDDGLVALTTDYPDLMPVREYASDRATRAALVGAYNDLAWPDNDPVLTELLEVRAERAALLGYTDWADYETEPRMIGAGAEIPRFLDRLDAASAAAADAEYPELLARLRQDDPTAQAVTIADFWYVLGALKNERHGVDAQEVRSYFRFERVLPGVLETTSALLDVEYVPVDAGAWHEDVHSYDVLRDGVRLGRIHLDMHPRDGKFSHAACFGLVPGVRGRQLPESVLLCNFARGLMTHDEVVTFFHEFGHLVHGILGGDQRWARFSGVATEWDFVEAPSQLLEEWAWDAGVLQTFATNADGEPIPADLVAAMRRADDFGKGYQARTQMFYAAMSYWFHTDRPTDLTEATISLQERYSMFRYVDDTHMFAGFGHLDGYSSGYYTYMWSLVIAKDLFSAFDPDNLFDPEVAHRYRDQILAPGGTRDAADLVEDFLGRPYTFDAYAAWLAR